MYTYIPISPPSCVPLPPSLSHPSRWSPSTKLISLCYMAASHYLSILHLVVYICHSLTSSQLTPSPSPCPQVHSLSLCLYSCPFDSFKKVIWPWAHEPHKYPTFVNLAISYTHEIPEGAVYIRNKGHIGHEITAWSLCTSCLHLPLQVFRESCS